jgi:hypothetical protein
LLAVGAVCASPPPPTFNSPEERTWPVTTVFGEVFVFVFFGLRRHGRTTFTQVGTVNVESWLEVAAVPSPARGAHGQ